MERLCLDCREPIKGRIDKKFCDDNCRSSFNNHLRAADYVFLRQINLILQKNRKILKDRLSKEKANTTRELLLQIGFDFEYHTRVDVDKNGRIAYFCYEYGYLILENGEIMLWEDGK